MNYIIYNKASGLAKNKEAFDEGIRIIEDRFGKSICYDSKDFDGEALNSVNPSDSIVIMAGDGTLHVLVNRILNAKLNNDIYLYSFGTGNDFLRDLDILDDKEIVQINKYLKTLPIVSINGVNEYFLNGASLGFDADVCVKLEDNKLKGKTLNYKAIAFRLIMRRKNYNATVLVDNKEYQFKNVWLACTMNGRYQGGGMKCAPNQDRLGSKLTLVVIHDASTLKALFKFSKVFSGNYEGLKYVTALEGESIKVTFSSSTNFQTDGEITQNVCEYEIKK